MKQKQIVIDARESGTTTGRYVDKLIEYLHKLKPKHNLVILTRAGRVDFMKEIAPSFEIVTCRYKEFTFAEQIGLLRQVRGLKPDLVHFAMVQQPILYRGKVVTTMNDLTTIRFSNPLKNPIVFYLKQQIYKFVNYVVAHKSAQILTYTQFVKEDVAKFARINSRKITVTHLAADKIKDAPESMPELANKRFLLYVGRPQTHKNLDRLVETFELLRQEYPELRLVLAGKKDRLFKQLEKRTIHAGIKNVVFTDFVTEGQLRWLYENCAVYVFPSLSEGFGLPGLEAMIHGAPVVSSNATCLPEVYKDAAQYFDPLVIEDMANAIKNVLDNPTRRQTLVTRGYAVAEKYSWQNTAQKTLDVYNDVLSGS